MKRLALSSLLFLLPACGTTKVEESLFTEPNRLMGQEIDDRVDQITYQHREELYNNMLWLAQVGEQAIPSLLRGLEDSEPKVRSSCVWILGRIGDRRTIPSLKPLVTDDNERVRLEAARTLLVMGDVSTSPVLIEGLDSDKVQVRYLCHEVLKATSLRDFGYDHLSEDMMTRQKSVYEWRNWWSEQSGDSFFASSYAEEHNIDTGEPGWQPDVHAVPSGETAPDKTDEGSTGTPEGSTPSPFEPEMTPETTTETTTETPTETPTKADPGTTTTTTDPAVLPEPIPSKPTKTIEWPKKG